MASLLRHIEAVRNVTLPAGRLPFQLAGQAVGYVAEAEALHVAQAFPQVRLEAGKIALDQAGELPGLCSALAEAGRLRLRGEDFDVRAAFDGPVLTRADRGALPYFGLLAEGVHVNGIVRHPDGPHLWVGRRAMDRLLDPGKLDHVIGGGIPAGMGTEDTLIKEGQEEAGFSPEVLARAVPAGRLLYTMLRPEGLRRDRLHCYDLELPADIVPRSCDGEVASFELWPVEKVVQTLRDTDDFKFNVGLVLIDFLLRWSLLPDLAERRDLHAALYG